MKRTITVVFTVLIILSLTCAAYAQWLYPVPLSALQTDYIRLANKDFLLEDDYVPDDLVRISVKKTTSDPIQMRQRVSEALDDMFAAALSDGHTLYAKSGYRSYRTQRTMYYNRLERNNGKDDGVVAYPGSSDHQTGLGIDVVNYAWRDKALNADFGKTKEAIWMAENCADYGFVIRYPQGKQDITKIIYEPWHLRYVGVEAARYIMDNGLTLEEFTLEWQQVLAEYEAGDHEDIPEADDTQTSFQTDAQSGNNQAPEKEKSEPLYGADGDMEISFYD